MVLCTSFEMLTPSVPHPKSNPAMLTPTKESLPVPGEEVEVGEVEVVVVGLDVVVAVPGRHCE